MDSYVDSCGGYKHDISQKYTKVESRKQPLCKLRVLLTGYHVWAGVHASVWPLTAMQAIMQSHTPMTVFTPPPSTQQEV